MSIYGIYKYEPKHSFLHLPSGLKDKLIIRSLLPRWDYSSIFRRIQFSSCERLWYFLTNLEYLNFKFCIYYSLASLVLRYWLIVFAKVIFNLMSNFLFSSSWFFSWACNFRTVSCNWFYLWLACIFLQSSL